MFLVEIVRVTIKNQAMTFDPIGIDRGQRSEVVFIYNDLCPQTEKSTGAV